MICDVFLQTFVLFQDLFFLFADILLVSVDILLLTLTHQKNHYQQVLLSNADG